MVDLGFRAQLGLDQVQRAPRRRPRGLDDGGPPLRLLHVFTSFNTGGAQVRFANLVQALGPTFCHSVLALTGDYEASTLVPAGVDVRYLSPPAAGPAPVRLLRYRRLLERTRPDLLLTYNWGAIEFALANAWNGTPHLHHEDGFGPEEAHRQLRRRVWLRRLALRRSHVFVPSRTLQAVAVQQWRLDPERLHHIPNGVRTSPAQARRARVSAQSRRPVIVWAGALRPEKNALRMIEAFAPLQAAATLQIVGDGAERPRLLEAIRQRGLEGRVELLGRRTDARDIISQADILALSSDTEQMPLVVLEAMDAGLPIASVDVGDVRLMLSEPNRPFVTPICAHALSGALARLLGDAALRRAIGDANRDRVARSYRHEAMVDAHRSLLERLATFG